MDYQLSNPDNSLRSIVENIYAGTSHLPADEQQEILMQVVNSHTRLDLPYLRCLYFPESSPAARVPTKFPVPTGVVTQKFSFYLNTGATGSGFVGMCPQDTTYMPCFYSANGLPNKVGSSLGEDCSIKFIGESSNYLPQNFSHARLVGSSMQISWIGQCDQESGFLCSSHLFDTAPVCLSENLIEEGFYPVRTTPSKGIRLAYIPKDDCDTEFTQLNYQLIYVKGNDVRDELDITYDVKTWFDRPRRAVDPDVAKGNQIMGDGQSDLQPVQLEITDSVNSKQIVWANVPPQNQIAPNCYYGLHKGKGSYGMPNMMVCYWKGLPIGKDWLRVDVVRHFEVLPRQHIKDLVAVARTKPSTETMNHVSNGSSEVSDIHNNTIDDMAKFDHYSGSAMRTMLKDGLVTQSQFDAVNTSRHGNTHGPGQPVTSSMDGLIQGRDNRMQRATMSGLQLASSLFDFLPSAWLDKPLLGLLRKGIGYAADRAQTQGGGNLFGLSQGTPSYTKLVLQ